MNNQNNVNKELYNYVISEAKEMALTGVKTAMVPTSLLLSLIHISEPTRP